MSATIYSGVEGIDPPEIDFSNYNHKKYEEATDKYIEQVKEFCRKNSKGKNVGEIIKFGVADGYARYMVHSLRPLELIHLPLDDAYQSEFAELLTIKKVNEMVEREKVLKKLFSK